MSVRMGRWCRRRKDPAARRHARRVSQTYQQRRREDRQRRADDGSRKAEPGQSCAELQRAHRPEPCQHWHAECQEQNGAELGHAIDATDRLGCQTGVAGHERCEDRKGLGREDRDDLH